MVLGGDFNVPLNPLHDTSFGTTTLPYKALCAIKKHLQELTLHDSWRTLNPNVKDYTFYSAQYGRYFRLDYLFLSQGDLPMLISATIEPIYLSDHHPISMAMEFAGVPSRSSILRLDPSLLTDSAIALTINQGLVQYFRENNSPDISPMTRWEAHKQAHITKLREHNHRLERAHKLTQAASSLQELLQARDELVEELDKKMKRNYILSEKKVYEYGNKACRLLARAL